MTSGRVDAFLGLVAVLSLEFETLASLSRMAVLFSLVSVVATGLSVLAAAMAGLYAVLLVKAVCPNDAGDWPRALDLEKEPDDRPMAPRAPT